VARQFLINCAMSRCSAKVKNDSIGAKRAGRSGVLLYESQEVWQMDVAIDSQEEIWITTSGAYPIPL
jgi:hypothetical protein